MKAENVKSIQDRMPKILDTLSPLYPHLKPGLDFQNPFQLLVSTVLSAQCTDETVNKVSPILFAQYPGPQELGSAEITEVEKLIYSTGFYHNKAKHLIGLSQYLLRNFGGEIPQTMEELISLPGVGRKTAGVVLSACFGGAAIIVDTHFERICGRLGFTESHDPGRVEKDIARVLEKSRWTQASYLLNRHGKFVCIARKPRCAACIIASLCPSAI